MKPSDDSIGDPDLLAARRRRPNPVGKAATPDLHEDWAAVQGLPPYAYWLDWPYSDNYALMRLIVLGKRRGIYTLKIDKVLYKTKLYERKRRDEVISLPGNALCFTRHQLERRISTHQKHHSQNLGCEIRRMALCLEDVQRQLGFLGVALQDLNTHEVFTKRIWDQIPLRKPK